MVNKRSPKAFPSTIKPEFLGSFASGARRCCDLIGKPWHESANCNASYPQAGGVPLPLQFACHTAALGSACSKISEQGRFLFRVSRLMPRFLRNDVSRLRRTCTLHCTALRGEPWQKTKRPSKTLAECDHGPMATSVAHPL